MTFNPDRTRENLLEVGIPLARKYEFDEILTDRALEGCAHSALTTSIQCCLVGMFEVARELLPKARDFYRGAIEHSEIPRYYFPGGTEAARCAEFSLCEWFVRGNHDLDSLRRAVEWQEQWYSRSVQLDKSEVQATLPFYLEAQEYETLFRRFAAAGLKEPRSLRQIRGEGTMSHVLACHDLGLKFSAAEVQDALRAFLKKSVPTWCDRHQFVAMARWMKIAHWKPGDDPIAILLKCFDYLPDFSPPLYS